LTNGMAAVPYVHTLSKELKGAGWRLYVSVPTIPYNSEIATYKIADDIGYNLIGLVHMTVMGYLVLISTY
jgi:hypothetical protein